MLPWWRDCRPIEVSGWDAGGKVGEGRCPTSLLWPQRGDASLLAAGPHQCQARGQRWSPGVPGTLTGLAWRVTCGILIVFSWLRQDFVVWKCVFRRHFEQSWIYHILLIPSSVSHIKILTCSKRLFFFYATLVVHISRSGLWNVLTTHVNMENVQKFPGQCNLWKLLRIVSRNFIDSVQPTNESDQK